MSAGWVPGTLDRQVLKSWGERADRYRFWGPSRGVPPAPRPCRPSPLCPPGRVVPSPWVLSRVPPQALSTAPRVATPHPGAGPRLPHSLCLGARSQLRESRGGAVVRGWRVPPRPGQGAPCRAPQACGSPAPASHLWVSHPGPWRSCPRPPSFSQLLTPAQPGICGTQGRLRRLWFPGHRFF